MDILIDIRDLDDYEEIFYINTNKCIPEVKQKMSLNITNRKPAELVELISSPDLNVSGIQRNPSNSQILEESSEGCNKIIKKCSYTSMAYIKSVYNDCIVLGR